MGTSPWRCILSIISALIERGARIRAHDPQGMQEARSVLPDAVEYCDDIYETVVDADAVILLTEWNAYRGLDMQEVQRRMRSNVFVDLRNVYEPESMKSIGFHYVCVGR